MNKASNSYQQSSIAWLINRSFISRVLLFFSISNLSLLYINHLLTRVNNKPSIEILSSITPNSLLIGTRGDLFMSIMANDLLRIESQILEQEDIEKRDPLISIESDFSGAGDYNSLPPKISRDVKPLLAHLGLKKGDRFKIYYQSGKVRLVRSGKKFVVSHNMGMYDHSGFRLDAKQSSRQTITLVTSVTTKNPRISSKYGPRFHPIHKQNRFHSGIDVSAPIGSKVHSAFDGRVLKVGYNGTYGTYITVQHEDSVTSLYAHLDSVAVKVGDFVTQGHVIGRVGRSGRATGPHLHFEVRKDGKHVNPKTIRQVSIRMRDRKSLQRLVESLTGGV